MTVDYQVLRTRRRSLELRLYPDKRVEVRAPLRTTDRDIVAFVDSKSDWLRRRLAALGDQPAPRQPVYTEGEEHLFLGQRHPLQLHTASREETRIDLGVLRLQLPNPESAGQVSAQLTRWYRQQAQERYSALLDQHFPFFARRGHLRPQLRIRRMKSRWGSLSSRGYINLNLELIKTPQECIEYVVLHELCHLEHMNHGAGFRALLGECLPDWQQRRQKLNSAPLI